MIREGQIWVRRKDEDYLPDDSWKVQIQKADRNGITYKIIEYNGEPTNGVMITAPQSEFRGKYYPERGER